MVDGVNQTQSPWAQTFTDKEKAKADEVAAKQSAASQKVDPTLGKLFEKIATARQPALKALFEGKPIASNRLTEAKAKAEKNPLSSVALEAKPGKSDFKIPPFMLLQASLRDIGNAVKSDPSVLAKDPAASVQKLQTEIINRLPEILSSLADMAKTPARVLEALAKDPAPIANILKAAQGKLETYVKAGLDREAVMNTFQNAFFDLLTPSKEQKAAVGNFVSFISKAAAQ